VRKIFVGPGGIRAGWRLAIFVAILVLFRGALFLVGAGSFRVATLEPRPIFVTRTISFGMFAAAAAIMAWIEKRPWGTYGLPPRRALGRDTLVGALWGLGSLSFVMLVLHVSGCYAIDRVALHGTEVATFGGGWAAAFVALALTEEFSLRGYPQWTLASGMGFWPAATLLSLAFVGAHMANPGENPMGLLGVFLIGMFFCFTLLRTGTLWFAVAMHAAWDWGLSFFYSVPDSAMPAVGHLFDVRLEGPTWLTGGTAGPEGSVVCLAVQVVSFPLFYFYTRRRLAGSQPEASLASSA
jgi:membrane protease YdiL (CAAX protease family)